jgi:hypothetical protein
MKLLAIHSNKLFFKKGAPNFYEWLCRQRGLLKQYEELKKEYNKGRNGPKVLLNTFCLSTVGLTLFELERYCEKFRGEFIKNEIASKISRLAKEMKILIFTSYPRELYANKLFRRLKIGVFGVEPVLDDSKIKIVAMDTIRLIPREDDKRFSKNAKEVRKRLEKLSFMQLVSFPGPYHFGQSEQLRYEHDEKNIRIEPDRYGMLALLIDQMIELGAKKEDVIVVGTGITAEPMHKVAGRVVESLEEL